MFSSNADLSLCPSPHLSAEKKHTHCTSVKGNPRSALISWQRVAAMTFLRLSNPMNPLPTCSCVYQSLSSLIFLLFLVHSALVFCSFPRIWFLFFSTRTIPVFYRSQKHCNFLTPITLWHQGKARQPRNFAAHTPKARAIPHTYFFPLEIPVNAALSCAVLCPSCLDSTAPRAHHVISHLWPRLGILWAAKKVCNFPLGCFFKLTCICLRLRTVKPYKRFKFCSFWASQTPKVLKRHCGWVTSRRR